MSSKRILYYLAIFIVTLPIQLASFDIVSSFIRDNGNYLNFFNRVQGSSLSFLESFYIYSSAVGSKEPVFFLLGYFFQYLGVSYEGFILCLNLLLVFSLARFLFNLKLGLPISCLLLVYFSSDYYLYTLTSEIHRLKLALVFFLFGMSMSKRRAIFSVLMVLSHFQTILLLPFLIPVTHLIKKYYAIIIIVLILMLPHIQRKFLFYLNDNDGVIISLAYIFVNSVIFLFLYPILVGRSKLNVYFVLWMGGMCVSLVVLGQERLNIFIVEVGVIYFSYVLSRSYSSFSMLFHSVVVVSLVVYNIYKMIQQHDYLLSIAT